MKCVVQAYNNAAIIDLALPGVVVRAFVLQSVDLGFISQVESCQKTFKNGIHSFPAWRSANRDSVENKPYSLLVVFLGKTLNGMPSSLCGRQVVGPV